MTAATPDALACPSCCPRGMCSAISSAVIVPLLLSSCTPSTSCHILCIGCNTAMGSPVGHSHLTAAVHAAAAASPAMLTSQSCSLLLKMLPLLRLLLQLLSFTMPWGQSSSHIFCWCLALQAHWQGADTAGVQHCPKLTLLCLEPIHEACMLETSVCNGA